MGLSIAEMCPIASLGLHAVWGVVNRLNFYTMPAQLKSGVTVAQANCEHLKRGSQSSSCSFAMAGIVHRYRQRRRRYRERNYAETRKLEYHGWPLRLFDFNGWSCSWGLGVSIRGLQQVVRGTAGGS